MQIIYLQKYSVHDAFDEGNDRNGNPGYAAGDAQCRNLGIYNISTSYTRF